MAWFYLVLGGLFVVGFTTCLKFSNNFTNWKWLCGVDWHWSRRINYYGNPAF